MWVGRTVGAMDGAIEPPWTGLRRVLPTHTAPPNQQTAKSRLLLLLLLLLLLWPRRVQGAALPEQPLDFGTISIPLGEAARAGAALHTEPYR